MEDIALRIRQLMEYHGLNISDTAKKIGVSQPNLSAMLSGKRPIGGNIVNKFIISFGINKDWLESGKGEMIKSVQPFPEKANDVDSDINGRINKIAKDLFDKQINKMAQKTFIRQKKLEAVMRGDEIPDYDDFCNVAQHTNVNLEWLITGKGPMLKEEAADSLPAAQKIPDNYRLIPLYNLDAVGGLHSSNLATLDNQYVEELVPFEDARVGDVSIWVTGESMIPTCPPGSKILIRKVVDWREYFGFGNMFVLLLNDGRRILKEVVKSEENPKTYVLCKSHNPKYSPEELPKSKIEEVWKVIQVHITKGW